MKEIGAKLGRTRKIHLRICKREHNTPSLKPGDLMKEWTENENKTPPSQQADKAASKTPQIANPVPQFSYCLAFCLGRSPCKTGSGIQVGWSETCALVEIRRGTRGGAQQRTRGERSQRKPLGFSAVVGVETSRYTQVWSEDSWWGPGSLLEMGRGRTEMSF